MRRRPEKDWQSHEITKTFAEAECLELKKKNCPIHCFYIGRYAEKPFKVIKDITGGEYQEFPVNNLKASELLSDFMIKKILTQASLKEK